MTQDSRLKNHKTTGVVQAVATPPRLRWKHLQKQVLMFPTNIYIPHYKYIKYSSTIYVCKSCAPLNDSRKNQHELDLRLYV
jgi:hypothetical protein